MMNDKLLQVVRWSVIALGLGMVAGPWVSGVASSQLSISPVSVEGGQEIRFSGSGFTPNGQVVVALNFQNQSMVAIENKVDESGDFVGDFFRGLLFRLPSAAPIGEWKGIALDLASEESTEQEFIVLPFSRADEAVQFAQMGIHPGESLMFTASGYKPEEGLRVQIRRPDASEIEYEAHVDKQGKLEGTVSVPVDRPLGPYGVIITGQTSGHEARGWFTVDFPALQVDAQTLKECEWTFVPLGDMVGAPIWEITFVRVIPADLAEWRTSDGALEIHCVRQGQGNVVVRFVPAWTGLGVRVERLVVFQLDCE